MEGSEDPRNGAGAEKGLRAAQKAERDERADASRRTDGEVGGRAAGAVGFVAGSEGGGGGSRAGLEWGGRVVSREKSKREPARGEVYYASEGQEPDR